MESSTRGFSFCNCGWRHYLDREFGHWLEPNRLVGDRLWVFEV